MTHILLAALLTLSSTLRPSYTKDEIRAEYDQVVKLVRSTYEGKEFFTFSIDTSTTSDVTPYFRENFMLNDYLRANYHQVMYEYHKRIKLPGSYKEILKDSAQLVTIMFERFLPLISNDLNAKGSKIEGYEPWVRPTITLDRLAGNAAKFFYPDSVLPDGRISAHVCVGLNGFQDLQDVRSVMMEAFCWSVIQPMMFVNDSPLLDEFSKASRFANDLQLSSKPDTKLKRYQGVMWAYMSRSKLLRDLLLAEYEKKKYLLTFTLKPE